MFNNLYEQIKIINESLVKKYISQTNHSANSYTENIIDVNFITIDDIINSNNLVFSHSEINNLIEKNIPVIGLPVLNAI